MHSHLLYKVALLSISECCSAIPYPSVIAHQTFPLAKSCLNPILLLFANTFAALCLSLSALYFQPCFAFHAFSFFDFSSLVCLPVCREAGGVARSEAFFVVFVNLGLDLVKREEDLKEAKRVEGTAGAIGPDDAEGRCWIVVRLFYLQMHVEWRRRDGLTLLARWSLL